MKRKAGLFKKALPVWMKGREKEKNVTCAFYTELPSLKGVAMRLTGCTYYNVFINGRFFTTGPARAAKGFFRVDEYVLDSALTNETNEICVLVFGYNINGYAFIDQPAFFCCEIEQNGNIIKATGDKNGFECYDYIYKLQKVPKYSFQRGFCEVYDLNGSQYDVKGLPLSETEITKGGVFTERGVDYTDHKTAKLDNDICDGVFTLSDKEKYYDPRQITGISDIQKGYKKDELTIIPTKEAERMDFKVTKQNVGKIYSFVLGDNSFKVLSCEKEKSGFITFDVKCEKDTVIYLLFDEIAKDGLLPDFLRMDCCNVVIYRIKAGSYTLTTNEIYSLKYLQIVSTSQAEISNVGIILEEHNDISKKLISDDKDLLKIYDAAVNTFKQNAVDIFMDCPSRERAGWLCDSFFTARVEYALTGGCKTEINFLQNFINAESFPSIPDGMIPMCYPADHYNKVFIPNWAMWFVLQLREHKTRCPETDLVSRAKDKVYKLFEYFKKFENEYGLLESLESWIFIEWSESNKLTRDVSFPTNMLYAEALRAAGELYSDRSLKAKGDAITETVRKMSYTGPFFCDNAVRKDGELVLSGKCTETCQYYAFYFGVADRQSFPELYEIMMRDFGPKRKKTGLWKDVPFSNSLIGNYLRCDLLSMAGNFDKLLDEIKGYFLYMAEKTGTLWENDNESASCNHGFASHVIVWLERAGLLK